MNQQLDTAPAARVPVQTAETAPAWATYSELKRELQRAGLSPREYEQAVRELCRELGL